MFDSRRAVSGGGSQVAEVNRHVAFSSAGGALGMELLLLVGNEDARLARFRPALLAFPALLALTVDTLKQYVRQGHVLGLVLCASAAVGAALVVAVPERRAGFWLGLAATCSFVALTFPTTANHGYLTLWCMALAVWAHVSPLPDKPLILTVAKWQCVIVLIASGLQKLMLGTYDHGEYFAFQLARGEPRFTSVLSPWVSIEDLSRTMSVDGRYAFASFGVPTMISLFVPCAEIALGLLLLVPGVRRSIANLACVFLLTIQIVTGEFTFALLMVALCATFLPVRRMVGVSRFAAVLLIVIGGSIAFGALPVDIN